MMDERFDAISGWVPCLARVDGGERIVMARARREKTDLSDGESWLSGGDSSEDDAVVARAPKMRHLVDFRRALVAYVKSVHVT